MSHRGFKDIPSITFDQVSSYTRASDNKDSKIISATVTNRNTKALGQEFRKVQEEASDFN